MSHTECDSVASFCSNLNNSNSFLYLILARVLSELICVAIWNLRVYNRRIGVGKKTKRSDTDTIDPTTVSKGACNRSHNTSEKAVEKRGRPKRRWNSATRTRTIEMRTHW